MKIYSFAYGSNMLLRKLQVNVPSAAKVANAFLPGYEFKFNKLSKDGSTKANIMKSGNPDDIVWGVVYEIEASEKIALDKEEGLGAGYNEERLMVFKEDLTPIEALSYVADSSAIQEELEPYDWYRYMVVQGAEENSLDEDYLGFLCYFIFIVDSDEERSRLKYRLLNS